MQIDNRQSARKIKPVVVVRLTVLAIVFTAIGAYLYSNWDKFADVFTSVSSAKIALVLFMDFLYYAVAAVIMAVILLPYSIRLGKMEAFEISMATRFGNLLLPFRGGAVARAVYLNKRYQFSPAMFVANLSGMLLASIFTGLLWAGAGLVFIGLLEGIWFLKPLLLVAVATVGLLVLAMVRVRIKPSRNRILAFAANLAEGWVKFANHKLCLLGLILSYSALIVLQSIMYAVLLDTGGASVHWSYIVVLVALGNISLAFQLTPGNAGVYEGLLAGVSSLMGLDYQAVLAAGLTWRVIDAVFVFILGGLAGRQLTRRCTLFLQSKNERQSADQLAAQPSS